MKVSIPYQYAIKNQGPGSKDRANKLGRDRIFADITVKDPGDFILFATQESYIGSEYTRRFYYEPATGKYWSEGLNADEIDMTLRALIQPFMSQRREDDGGPLFRNPFLRDTSPLPKIPLQQDFMDNDTMHQCSYRDRIMDGVEKAANHIVLAGSKILYEISEPRLSMQKSGSGLLIKLHTAREGVYEPLPEKLPAKNYALDQYDELFTIAKDQGERIKKRLWGIINHTPVSSLKNEEEIPRP